MTAARGRPTREAFAGAARGARPLLGLRWVRVVLLVLAAAVFLRLTFGLLLSAAIDALLAPQGLECSWEDLDLSVLSGRGEVRDLAIAPDAEGAEPIAVVDYALFDLEVLPLLVGRLRVRRLEIDGGEVRLERAEDGIWNFARHLPADPEPEESPAREPSASPAATPEPIDLSAPLAVDALRLQDLYVRLADKTFDPPFERRFHVDAGLTGVGSVERRSRLSATVTGDRILDGAHLEGEAEWTRDRVALDLRLQLGGLRPRELDVYLEPLGVHPACDSIQGRLVAHVEADVVGEARDTLRIAGALVDVGLSADGIESLALDRLTFQVESLSPAGATVPRIEIAGARAHASLGARDTLRIAGLDLETAAAPADGSSTTWVDSLGDLLDLWMGDRMPPWAARLARDDPDAYSWSLASVSMRESSVWLVDRRVEPPAEFPVILEELDLRGLVHDRAGGAMSLLASLRVPGTCESIRAEGSIAPFAPQRSIDLAIGVEGIGFDALAGHLRAAGLEPTRQRGGLRIELSGAATTDAAGRTEGNLELSETLTLDGEPASQLGRVRASGLLVDPTQRLVRIGDVEIAGTRLLFGRDPSHRLVGFGVRTLGLDVEAAGRAAETPDAPKPRPAAAPAAPTAAARSPLPRIELGRLAWTDTHLAFLDESQDPPIRLAVDPIGFELTGLTLGGEPGGAEPPPARLVARAAAPGIFEELSLEGSIATKLGDIDLAADLALKGSGLRGTLVAPYLRPRGIEPGLEDGTAALAVRAELREAGGWRASLRLSGGKLEDAGGVVASLGEIAVEDVATAGDLVSIGRVAIVEPFANVRRAGSGVVAGGLRYVGLPEGEAAAEAESGPPPALAFPELPKLRLDAFELRGARVAFRDESVDPPVDLELLLDGSARALATTGEPGEAAATLRIPGVVEALELRAGGSLGAKGFRLEGSVDARGVALHAGNGRFSVDFEAEVAPAEAGGLRARVAARDLSWRDGDEDPWLALARASLEIPRVDPAAGVLEIGPGAVEGLVAEASRDADGVLRALGLRIEDAPRPAPPEPEPAGEPPARTPLAIPFARVALAGDLAFSLDRFRYSDASLGEGARPIEAALAFRVPGPLELLDQPIGWRVDASIAGLLERCRIEGELRPFADEPGIAMTLAGSGVRTQGLLEIAPALAVGLRGDVEAGTLEGKLDATFAVRRGRHGEIGFDRPFGGELRLEGLAYRSEPGGDVLLGVESIVADVAKVDPERGLVHVKTLDVVKPRGLVRRTPDAISVAGIALDLAPEPAQPEPAAEVEEPPPPAPPETVADEPTKSELRIDRILVSGVEAELRDTARDPPVVLPLAGLDLEAGPLTTRALRERAPLRFHVAVTGGPPARGGAVAAEAAPVFDELVLAGDVALRPKPAGWVQLTLTGLELAEVAALAPTQAVGVHDGALDLRVHAKLEKDGGARVQSTVVFTDLDVEEPSGGPIESGLSLPLTLDAALFVLRNPAGEHRLSVGFEVDEGGVSGGQMALAATSAMAQVLGVALAGAPLRLLGALVPESEKEARGPRATREIAFAAGASDPPPDLAEELLELRRELAANASLQLVVRHELGAADVARAQQLANPPESECRDLVGRARQRKAELLRGRAVAATRARALLAVGASEAEAASKSLRGIDRELSAVEDALDGVLAILRSPSERQALKRTRVAALEIGQARLDAIAETLRAGLDADGAKRLDVRSPRFEVVAGEGGGRVVLELRER